MPPPERPNAPQRPQEAAPGPREAEKLQSTVPAPQAHQKAAQEPEAKKYDETVPGGRFEVNGRMVDAFGVPLDEKKK